MLRNRSRSLKILSVWFCVPFWGSIAASLSHPNAALAGRFSEICLNERIEFDKSGRVVLAALADKCSVGDRVPLPGCMTAEYLEGGVILTNYCDHVVTIKVDIANGSDKRIDVGANGGRTTVPINGRYKLSCCPKYNRCK